MGFFQFITLSELMFLVGIIYPCIRIYQLMNHPANIGLRKSINKKIIGEGEKL